MGDHLRVVSVGNRKSLNRLLAAMTYALGDADVELTDDQEKRVAEALVRYALQEGWVITCQVAPR